MSQNGAHTHVVDDPGHGHGGGRAIDYMSNVDDGQDGVEEGRGHPDWRMKYIGNSGTGISLQQAGGHGHVVTVQSANAGIAALPSGAGISLQQQGVESRPSNIAFGAFVKF